MMNVRSYVLILGFSCLVMTGCSQSPKRDVYLEQLRAEKIWFEDQYYELEQQHGKKLAELEDVQNENRELLAQLGLDLDDVRQAERPSTRRSSDNNKKPNIPAIESGARAEAEATDNDLPNRSLDGGVDDSSEFASYRRLTPLDDEQYMTESDELDTRVTHIVLNPKLTGGHDFDQRLGDDGISVLIEPRNADDRFVPIPGAVMVSVLDPMLKGEAARVAFWEMDAEEISRRMKSNTRNGRGINLKLPWPDRPPEHSDLHLFVRYVTEDDRKLMRHTEISVAKPGEYSHRWTPKSSGSRDTKPLAARDIGNTKTLIPRVMPASAEMTASGNVLFSKPKPSEKRTINTKSTKSQRPVWRPYR